MICAWNDDALLIRDGDCNVCDLIPPGFKPGSIRSEDDLCGLSRSAQLMRGNCLSPVPADGRQRTRLIRDLPDAGRIVGIAELCAEGLTVEEQLDFLAIAVS